jgi:antitoxin MazE
MYSYKPDLDSFPSCIYIVITTTGGIFMENYIRSIVIKIGNSHVIRIPRTLLEQAGLTDEVEMIVEGDKLIIQSVKSPRQGWEAEFEAMVQSGVDMQLDEHILTLWDEEEWEW